jgi:hypothetical protein
MEPAKANPALADLTPLLGDWVIEIVFPRDPPNEVFGTMTCAWLDDGAFLVMRTRIDWEGPGSSICVIGRDDAEEAYSLLYFDDRGVSRIYKMQFGDGLWRQWRMAPGFSQRFTGTLGFEGKVISAKWEASDDNEAWELDFELTYRRADRANA